LTIRLPREQRREGIKICAKREKDERWKMKDER
jgi:hypothetical protein